MIKSVAVAVTALGLPAGQSFVGPSAGVVRVSKRDWNDVQLRRAQHFMIPHRRFDKM